MRFSLFVCLLMCAMSSHAGVYEKIATLDEARYKVFLKQAKSAKASYIYVHAWWCGSCILYRPKIKRFAKNTDNVLVWEVDYNNSRSFLKKTFAVPDRGYVLFFQGDKYQNKQPYPRQELLEAALSKK